MITLVTGDRNQGKTRLITDLFREKNGDGIISKKIFRNQQPIGYQLYHLATGNNYPFILKKGEGDHDWEDCISFGAFHFRTRGFQIGMDIILGLINQRVQPIYLDEIGLLELEGKGFAGILPGLFASNLDAFLTIRTPFREQLAEKFPGVDFQIRPV